MTTSRRSTIRFLIIFTLVIINLVWVIIAHIGNTNTQNVNKLHHFYMWRCLKELFCDWTNRLGRQSWQGSKSQDSGCRWDNLFRISLRYGLQSSLINILVEWTNGNGNGLAFNLSVTAKSGRGGFELRWIAKNSVAAIFSQPLWPWYMSP